MSEPSENEKPLPLHVEVAKALGCKPKWDNIWGGDWFCGCPDLEHEGREACLFEYDTDWSATGPLIEKYRIQLQPCGTHWLAQSDLHGWEAPTPLIAICRLLLVLSASGKL